MAALTEFLDKPIRDPSGEEFARLRDLVVRLGTDDTVADGAVTYPPVTGLVVRLKSPRGVRDVYIPWEQVEILNTDGAQLNSPAVNLRRFAPREGEIVLRDALFDRQVVDVEGRRVVRINDLDLAPRDGIYRLVAVDVSPAALLRRLPMGQMLNKRLGPSQGPLIDWAQVIPVAQGAEGTGALQLRVPRNRLALLKPSDLARVVEQLTPQQGADLLQDVDDARAADALEELEDERQGQILRAMDPERAADVLEEMEPDEATDALQSVTSDTAADLLQRMNREDAVEVQQLLGYPEDSAGGIMTTDYIAVADWATTGEVVGALRARARASERGLEDPLPDALLELYVVHERGKAPALPAERTTAAQHATRPRAPLPPPPTSRALSLGTEGRLVGAVSLRDLLLADSETPLLGVVQAVPEPAHALDNERDVARVIADQDLLALPVVDDAGMLLGIVTVDDAIDVILPTAWKKRLPRVFR